MLIFTKATDETMPPRVDEQFDFSDNDWYGRKAGIFFPAADPVKLDLSGG